TAAYFSSRYRCISSFVRSAAIIVIASAGQERAQSPQAVQRSRPSSSRFSECSPRKFFEYGRCSSGYFTVGIFLKKCRIVIPRPFAIAGRYMRSQKFMGFCSITFFLFDKDCIVLKISILHNDHCGSQDNICYRQRKQYLPSETHQLIIAETWQCPAYPHEEKDKAENLQEENQHPDDRNPILGQTQLIHKREIISAEVQGSHQCR